MGIDLSGFGVLGSPMTTAAGNTQGMGMGNIFPETPLAIPTENLIAPVDYSSLANYGSLAPGGGIGGAGGGGFFGNMNGMQKVGAGLQLAQGLMGLYSGLKMMKLAKKDFNMRRDMANINLNNTIKSYNTALSDRARARGFTEGQSQSQIDSYVSSNSMTRDASRRNVGG